MYSSTLFNLGTRRECVVSITPPAAFTPRKDPVLIVQEAGWAPEAVWIGAENLAPPGFDPKTFQPVASHYTDYAIAAPFLSCSDIISQRSTDAHYVEYDI
jgi:hypothetical protein